MVIVGKFRLAINTFFLSAGGKLAELGIRPNQLTFAGFILSILAALWIILTKDYLIAGFLLILLALIDFLDGSVARASGKVTKFGSYLDGMLDRYVDGVILFAIAYSTGYWMLSFVVLFGTICTSYAKARAAIEVRIENAPWPDLVERLERGLIIIFALILQGIFKIEIYYQNFIFWGLIILAITTNITVVQRMFRAREIIKKNENP
jgi:phosphatidylglycerophosphate synthase